MQQVIVQFAKIRRHKKISYQEIENRTGITSARLKELESGSTHITIDELERLLGFYQMTFEQVMKYRPWNKAYKAALAALVSGVLFFCVIYFSSGIDLWKQASPNAGQETVQAPETSAGVAEQADEDLGGDSSGDMPVSGSETPPEEDSVDAAATVSDSASPAIQDPVEKVVFRFWGNIAYDAESLPQVHARDDARVMEIVPVEQLSNVRPGWLQAKPRDQLLINAGTTEVWTPTTVEAYQALKQDDYHAIGLGKLPDVYEPHMIEVNSMKIGFLSLTGLIHHADEIALKSRVGLPRAYRKDEVTEAVKRAKEQVDYLFVLIDWGKKRSLTPNTSQKAIAETIVQAGGDFIIGNHPYHSQDFTTIDGKPVFYALGHSVSDYAEDNSYNLIVETEFSSKLDKVTVIFGKLKQGQIHFDLTPDDRDKMQAAYGDKAQLMENWEIVW